ncbi:MAG TPA: M48 family metalloprotease [Caulobacteraceae bacterium]|jgi:predicted Zn-dependent protease|nr:M48 family metalloprotease [Caulobacteraceae bacterium]
MPRFLAAGRLAISALAMTGVLLAPVSQAFAQDDAVSIIRDTEIEHILHEEADPIFQAAGLNPKAVQIHLVESNEINAFSAGGQQVFLYTGLILKTDNPNQLIGVIAHETGHIAGGHLARSGDFTKAGLAPMLMTIGLGILAAIAGAPEAAAALVFSSTYFGELNVLTYSREQESRADQAAATYLEKAGMSGRGLVSFFDAYRYQEVFDDERKFPYFRDHPLSDDRIEALKVRVEHQPHYAETDSPQAIERYEIMKAKLEGFILGGQTMTDYPSEDQSFPARYARAIALYRGTEIEPALKQIDALLAEHPKNPYLWELKGQVLFESGRTKESEPAHRRSVELDPDAPLLQVNLAQTLIAEGAAPKYDEAILHIRRSLGVEPDNPLAWRLLSEAYDGKGDEGMAHLASAEQNFYLGQLLQARTFAYNARELLQKGTPEWRRATDIIMASKPTPAQLRQLGISS